MIHKIQNTIAGTHLLSNTPSDPTQPHTQRPNTTPQPRPPTTLIHDRDTYYSSCHLACHLFAGGDRTGEDPHTTPLPPPCYSHHAKCEAALQDPELRGVRVPPRAGMSTARCCRYTNCEDDLYALKLSSILSKVFRSWLNTRSGAATTKAKRRPVLSTVIFSE